MIDTVPGKENWSRNKLKHLQESAHGSCITDVAATETFHSGSAGELEDPQADCKLYNHHQPRIIPPHHLFLDLNVAHQSHFRPLLQLFE